MSVKELEPRVARLEAALEAISKTLDGINEGIRDLNHRIDQLGRDLNSRVDQLGRDLNGRIDRLFFWILGTFLAVSLQIWLRR